MEILEEVIIYTENVKSKNVYGFVSYIVVSHPREGKKH